jgi:purine catabolism regulator
MAENNATQYASTQDRPVVTVRDVLEMSTVQLGDPHILAAPNSLDASVRWVHIASGTGVAALLEGGELLLTTGAGWPDDEDLLLHEVNDLINANISAVFIELGARFASIPDVIVDICEKRNIALIALRVVTPFVQITEQVHRAILLEQSEALTARDDVQAMLTRLGLNRAPVDYVIEQLATVLAAPVVLENTIGEVISWADPIAREGSKSVLAHWPRNMADALDARWNAVAVEARDARWGTLIACDGPPHPAGRQTVLELGAVALALGRLADPLQRNDRWINTNAKRLLSDLMQGRYNSDDEMNTRLSAAGMSFSRGNIYAFSLEIDGNRAVDPVEAIALLNVFQESLQSGAKLLAAEPGSTETSILGVFQLGQQLADGRFTSVILNSLERELEGSFAASETMPHESRQAEHPLQRLRLTIGPPASNTAELVTSLEMASAVAVFSPTLTGRRVQIAEIAKQPLAFLVSELRTDARLERFSRSVLAPLIDYDRQNNADLVRVLDAYTRNPTNRSDAAKAANLSRSVFYQRIALIEEVLGTDISDGITLATLTLALAAASPAR